MGITISLCMIVKNEEKRLDTCLSSVCDVVDEINIVDTGSTDRTVEIARQYTDRIYHFDWINDFSAARNFSFSKATKDYIMWLDADDILTPENAEKLRELKETLDEGMDYVAMMYHYAHDKDGNVLNALMRERLVKRASNFKWINELHEVLAISGNGYVEDIFVTHDRRDADDIPQQTKIRNLHILEEILKKGDPSWRTLYYYALTLQSLHRIDESLEIFNRLIKMPDDGYLVGVAVYISVFEIYMARGEYETAFNLLADREHLFYDKSEYYCALGDYYMFMPDSIDKACVCYMQALSCTGYERVNFFSTRNEQFYYYIPLHSLGMLFIKLKMYPEALSYMEQALKFYPTNDTLKNLIEKLKKMTEKLAKIGDKEDGQP